MSRIVSKSEADRLGKRGSYRLGSLSQPGAGRPGAPRPFRPSFSRPQHSGPVSAWVLGAVSGTAVIAGGAVLGLWFAPFVVGVLTGVVVRWGGWRPRVSVPAVLVMAAAGWGLPLWAAALGGLPVGAAARTTAALAGLPAHAPVTVAAALAVSAAQGLAGLWLGRAITPRPTRDELGS